MTPGRQPLAVQIAISVLLLIGVCCPVCALSQEAYRRWVPDYLGDSIEMRYVRHPDDWAGHVRSTIIRRVGTTPTNRGILYVHGYNDYFFQVELARRCNERGYQFYAVDLRKYGRSIMPGQRKFDARDMAEYFPDIDSALVDMRSHGITHIALMGHSTGGLLTAYYLSRRANPVKVGALVLNSPFLDWNLDKVEWLVPAVSTVGYIFPDISVPQSKSTAYAESLLKLYHGEWHYNRDWKLPQSPPVSAGWVRAVERSQKWLQKGDHPINQPILLMYSARGHNPEAWDTLCQSADIVLDPSEIKRYGVLLGRDVTCVKVYDGLHDLLLSRKGVRDKVYEKIFDWLAKNLK